MGDEIVILADDRGLDRIAPLWSELRAHHATIAPRWRASLLAASFEDRKAELLAKSAGGLQVLLAVRGNTTVGYCVSTIDQSGRGEVDSLFVASTHRRQGIGERLMTTAMQWLSGKSASPIAVNILAGNDDAVRFYQRFGFSPRTVMCLYTQDGG